MRPPYGPPHPWDDSRNSHHHRGRGRMVVERGKPVDVEFLGWRSNTFELQHHGWEIAERKMSPWTSHGETWGISIRHPKYGMSGMSVQNRIHTQQQMRQYPNEAPIHLHIEIGMPYMVQPIDSMVRFIPVDTQPRHVEICEPVDLYNMPYFHPIGEGKEIFLKKASVEEIMQIALDKQAPEQAEIRARQRHEQDRAKFRRGGEEKARIIMVA